MAGREGVSWPRRLRAVRAALRRLHEISRRESVFDEYDGHLLLAFCLIATTSQAPAIRRDALAMGLERARAWRRRWPRIRRHLQHDTIMREVIASYAIDRMGAGDDRIRDELRSALSGYAARDLLFFDPRLETAPRDVPEDCKCGRLNERGCTRCTACRQRLRAHSQYELWYYALTSAYFCERQGMPLRVGVVDLVRQTPMLRPYPAPDSADYYQAIYAVTHLVYTLSDYGAARLPRTWLRQERRFLKSAMRWAIDTGEADTIGEVVDSLAVLGVEDGDPLMLEGRTFLLEAQQADGGWGDEDADPYGQFHTLWTAIDGLRDYGWRGTAAADRTLRRVVRELAADSSGGRRTPS